MNDSVIKLGYVKTYYPMLNRCAITRIGQCKKPGVVMDVIKELMGRVGIKRYEMVRAMA